MHNIRALTSKHRTPQANERLGRLLAIVAGYINAGGFFIVQQYTSHMTGILSIAADEAALGHYSTMLRMLFYISCFVAGACITTMIVIKSRRKHLHSQYALPLLLEALLITAIAILFPIFTGQSALIPVTIAAICFLMGLQNALITKASTAIIRTTHVTGMTTDLGIEIGRTLLGANKADTEQNRKKALLHLSIITAFFVGGVIGAIATSHIMAYGFLPVAILLIVVAFPQLSRDFKFRRKWKKRTSYFKGYKS